VKSKPFRAIQKSSTCWLERSAAVCRFQNSDSRRGLGDVRGKAVTQGKIADVLQARGELDEALRIRCEEQLPVYERLGATRDLLVCRAKIALNLLARNSPGDRDEAADLLRQAHAAAEKMGLPEVDTIREIQTRERFEF
jgi:hypothetical protein